MSNKLTSHQIKIKKLKKLIIRTKVRLALKQISEEECRVKVSLIENKMDELSSLRWKQTKRKSERRKKLKLKKEKKAAERKLLLIKLSTEKAIQKQQERDLKSDPTKAAQREYERLKRKTNPLYRLSANLRHRTNMALKKGSFTKKSSLSEYLGCSVKEFKAHLEALWTAEMNWSNYGLGPGLWNMDHTIPLASAKSEEEIHKLCHYTNIRPMWSEYNCMKNGQSPEEWALYKLKHNIDESKPPSIAPLTESISPSPELP